MSSNNLSIVKNSHDNYQRSSSNDPNSTIRTNLIIESDLVIDSLNNIIDMHTNSEHASSTHTLGSHHESKKLLQNLLIKKSESFKKLTNFNQSKKMTNQNSPNLLQKALSTNLEPNENSILLNTISKKDKFKSKSYLINNANSRQSDDIISDLNPTSNLRKFLFSNSSSNTISGTKTKKLANNTNSENFQTAATTCFLNNSKKKRSSLFNLFSFSKSTSNTSTTSNQNLDSSSSTVNNKNTGLPPPPDEFADQPSPKSGLCSEVVSGPEWHKNFKFFLNRKTYKITSSNIPSNDKIDTKLDINKSDSSSLLSYRSNEGEVGARPNSNKKMLVRSKGFSIPLNASYCPNSLPVNCVQEHFLINNNNQSEEEQSLDLFEDVAETLDEDIGEPKPNDFDLVEENSCLKEVNLRLKYAEIRNLEDEEFSDFKETNLSVQDAEKETTTTPDTLINNNIEPDQEINSHEPPPLSSSHTILSLSLNNQCSTATTTLNENLNSINFEDTNSLSMFSQQNQSKANISKVMVNNYQPESNNENSHEKEENNSNRSTQLLSSKKKRFQQFQTRSLINLNGQPKKNAPSLENTIEPSIPSPNPSIKINDDSVDETLKADEIAPETVPDCISIQIQASLKPISQSVMLHKGVKLRDLFKPVFDENNLNIDEFNLYKRTDRKETDTNLVDLNNLCDTYPGYEFLLKQKLQKSNSTGQTKSNFQTPNNLQVSSSSKMRKSSLQIPNTDELNDIKLLSTNNVSHSSINNWQNYFNTKSSKEKIINKQKRNSCIAVMNDSSSGSSATGAIPINLTSNSSSSSITSNMRDSVSSFQNFMSSNSIGAMSSGSSPSDRVRPNRNFRRIAQISSIFTSYSQSRLPEFSKLSDQLNSYLKELPKLPEELSVQNFDASILDIEPDWNKFVGESFAQSLPIKVAKQQMAIWELLVTECSHIKTTKIIIDIFLSCLIGLKCSELTSDLFKDIDIKKLFCNIIEVFNCNFTFWQKYLNPIRNNLLSSSSNNNQIIDPSLLINAFSDFKTLFAPYEEFILERIHSTEYFKQKSTENENFSKFITWAENHPLVGRLKISDFMMIPVQRLTKYQLLIENIYQHTEDENKREKIALIKEWVNSLPNSINIKLSYLAQFNDISESIEKYEGVTGPNDEVSDILNSFKKFDIKSPLPGCSKSSVRELIHQGPLKLKDLPKSIDVHCFLFTDMLLITQQKKTKKFKIIKPPVSTHRMIIKELSQTDKAFVVISLNDYNVPDSVSMFISNQSKKWIEFLELSKKKYSIELEKHKHTNTSSVQQILNNFKFDNITNHPQTKSLPTTPLTDTNSIVFTPKIDNEPTETSTDPPLDPQPHDNLRQQDHSTSDQTLHNNDIDDKQRRDSSATLVLADNLSLSEHKDVVHAPPSTDSDETNQDFLDKNNQQQQQHKSPMLSRKLFKNQAYQYQKQSSWTASINAPARLFDRRIERQRRNMTDPNQHSMDERHSVIMKRNSLNDKSIKIQQNSPPKLVNLYGDSTSTILSTDSGVSNCDNQIGFSQESITRVPQMAQTILQSQSPTKTVNPLLRNVLSPSSPTSSSYSSSSNEPIYSNLSISSSSSKGYKPTRNIADEDFFEDEDPIGDEDPINEQDGLNKSLNDSIKNNFTTNIFDPSANNLMFKKLPNFRIKQSSIENVKLVKTNFDLNNNQTYMFHSSSDYYDYVNRTNEDDLINKNETQKLIQSSSSSSNLNISLNSNSGNGSFKRPLIKIKPTTVINESVRVKPEFIGANSQVNESCKNVNFDQTIDSAQINFNGNSSNCNNNGLSLDNHHRMILVNLLHTTLDAT